MGSQKDTLTVRPYRPEDRYDVRRLAVDTAECGSPSPGLFGDRELLADWLTDYYLDREPASCFVALEGHRRVGYLLGCLDPSKYANHMTFLPLKMMWRCLWRGIFFRLTTWKTLFRVVATVGQVRPYKNKDVLKGFPAHLHINLLTSHRNKGVGKALVETFFLHARATGTPGIHLGCRTDNPSRLFFEKMGFREAGRGCLPSWNEGGTAHHEVILYEKPLR